MQWGYHPLFQKITTSTIYGKFIAPIFGVIFSYFTFFANRLVKPLLGSFSFLGFAFLLALVMQLVSSIMLSWYYIPEPGLVVEVREEMFDDTRFGAEFYYIYSISFDALFLLSYAYMLKGVYSKGYVNGESDFWVLGGYAFFWLHYVAALGTMLNATHTGDLMLTVAANMYWSVFNGAYRAYYIIFTNKHLNTDQLIRLAILYYFTLWYYLYLLQLHATLSAESCAPANATNPQSYAAWACDVLLRELQDAWYGIILLIAGILVKSLAIKVVNPFYLDQFDTTDVDEIRYNCTTVQWYFRPLISFMIVTSTHIEGLFWICLFFILVAFMPVIYNLYGMRDKQVRVLATQESAIQVFAFFFFFAAVVCILNTVPCNRYYLNKYRERIGDWWLQFAFQYVFVYLAWLVHHLDFIDQIIFAAMKVAARKGSNVYKFGILLVHRLFLHTIGFVRFGLAYAGSLFSRIPLTSFFKKVIL